MKLFISTPNSKAIQNGIDYLRKIGHNVTVSEQLSDKNDKLIKDCDLLVIEVSELSYRTGYEIARALDEKKVVIVLELDTSNNSRSLPKSKSLIIKKYTPKNIAAVLERAIKEAESKLDSKFILIISPEIDRYLEWAGQTKRMHKAQIVRSAVEEVMRKDKEYREYLG